MNILCFYRLTNKKRVLKQAISDFSTDQGTDCITLTLQEYNLIMWRYDTTRRCENTFWKRPWTCVPHTEGSKCIFESLERMKRKLLGYMPLKVIYKETKKTILSQHSNPRWVSLSAKVKIIIVISISPYIFKT